MHKTDKKYFKKCCFIDDCSMYRNGGVFYLTGGGTAYGVLNFTFCIMCLLVNL